MSKNAIQPIDIKAIRQECLRRENIRQANYVNECARKIVPLFLYYWTLKRIQKKIEENQLDKPPDMEGTLEAWNQILDDKIPPREIDIRHRRPRRRLRRHRQSEEEVLGTCDAHGLPPPFSGR